MLQPLLGEISGLAEDSLLLPGYGARFLTIGTREPEDENRCLAHAAEERV
ncbi:hypothetical protein [Ensifer sp. ZNC0028]|nr:hypothetical protein [Ensifer sp. ZNC0028]